MSFTTTPQIKTVRRVNIGGRSVVMNSSSDESSSSASASSSPEEEEESSSALTHHRRPTDIMQLLERRRAASSSSSSATTSSGTPPAGRKQATKRKRRETPPPSARTARQRRSDGSSTEDADEQEEEERRRQRARTQNIEAQRALLRSEQLTRARDATEAAAADAAQNTPTTVAHAPIQDELEPLWSYENDQEEEKDERARRWQPSVSPFQRELDALLYEGEDSEGPCWACKFGEDETATVNGEHWDKMIKMFTSMLPSVDLPVIAQEIHRYFYTQVLAPLYNQTAVGKQHQRYGGDDQEEATYHRKCMQQLKRVWSPYKVIEHFRKILTPSIRLAIRLREVRSLIHLQLRNNTVEVHNTSGRERLNQNGVKLLADLVKLETALYNQKPDKQAFHNPRRSTSSDGYTLATPKRAMMGSLRPLPLFGSNS